VGIGVDGILSIKRKRLLKTRPMHLLGAADIPFALLLPALLPPLPPRQTLVRNDSRHRSPLV
jgi:hypothetical protein